MQKDEEEKNGTLTHHHGREPLKTEAQKEQTTFL
jgi:hypothetical protein